MNNRAIHSQRLETWLGKERVENLSRNMRGWYGPPIVLMDVPGGVRVNGDGDFSGSFERGAFWSAYDSLEWHLKRLNRKKIAQGDTLHAGLSSISDALAKATAGKQLMLGNGPILKSGTAGGAVGASVTLWYVGSQPAAGAAAAAAPNGTVPTSASTGALQFSNPTGGDYTMLVGADLQSSVAGMGLLIYDRLFSVTKTMASVATEAVTGVPTRYQNTTQGAPDYIGGNFLMIECRTVLPSTAHSWTTCLYTDQDDNAGVTLPSVTGINSCAANRLDMPVQQWFAPLASGDTGIKALTQMQCSASVATGAIDFTIGHPIGMLSFPVASMLAPYDWLTNRNQAPRIFDSACLALLQLPIISSTATTFTGIVWGLQG